MKFCPEMHLQGFVSVTGCNTKLERKQGSGKWVPMHKTWLCVARSAGKLHKGSRRLGQPQEALGNLRKELVRFRMYHRYGVGRCRWYLNFSTAAYSTPVTAVSHTCV